MGASKNQKAVPASQQEPINPVPEQKTKEVSGSIVLRTVLLFAAMVVILAGIKSASGILTPILLALFITIVLLVPLRWLHTKGCSSFLSFLIVGGCILGLFVGFGWVLSNSLNDFITKMPVYSDVVTQKIDEIEHRLHTYGLTLYKQKKANEKADDKSEEKASEDEKPEPSPAVEQKSNKSQSYEQKSNDKKTANAEVVAAISDAIAEMSPPGEANANAGLDIGANIGSEEVSDAEQVGDELLAIIDKSPKTIDFSATPPLPSYNYKEINPKLVVQWVAWGASEFRHLAESAFLVLIILMFMIFEAARFPAKLEKAFGGSAITNEHFHKITNDIRRYVLFKGGVNLLSCGLVLIFYYCLGVQYALLWAMIAFFLYFIPNIGSMIAAIPPLLLVFVDQGVGSAIILVVGLTIIESVIGYGLEPRLLGHGLGISTVVVFLSLIFWGWLLGPVGLFLAAPLTIVSKIILQTFDETRWVAVLLGE